MSARPEKTGERSGKAADPEARIEDPSGGLVLKREGKLLTAQILKFQKEALRQ